MPNTLVSVEPDIGSWNGIREIFWRCDRTTRVTWPDGKVEYVHCPHDSAYLVTQIGELTGRKFSMHLCDEHAKPYLEAINGIGSDVSE